MSAVIWYYVEYLTTFWNIETKRDSRTVSII